MRTFFDYLFYKYYRWYELLNKSYRRLNICWEEDSVWSAVLTISFLQGMLIDVFILFAIGILKHTWLVVSATEFMTNLGILYCFKLTLAFLPMGICYLLNRAYYIRKGNHKTVVQYWDKRGISSMGAIVFFFACFLLLFLVLRLHQDS